MATKLPTKNAASVGRSEDETNPRWWTETDSIQAGRGMVARARAIEKNQYGRFDEAIVFASFYAGKRITSLYQFGSGRRSDTYSFDLLGHRVTWNLAQSCVDTLAAKVAKNKARVMFQTFDGNWSQKRRSRELTKFIDGVYYENNLYDAVSEPCFLDASILDGGICQGWFDDDTASIQFERVLPIEILVDENEALYGAPRTLYRRKFYPRDVLQARFARGKSDKARETHSIIEGAAEVDATGYGKALSPVASNDMVTVYEAWRLPAGKDDVGVHIIAMEGATLFIEPYKRQRYPFAKYVDTPLQTGYWGKGIVAQIVGIQLEVNALLRSIQKAQGLMNVPRWLVPTGSNVVNEHISNEFGSILKYAGDRPPSPFIAPAMAPEVYAHLERLYAKAYEITGISSLSATGRKPEGLNAGVALREYHDIESERFVKKGQRFESFHCDIARIAIDLAREAYGRGKNVKVRAPMTKLIERIEWKDVQLDEDAYAMRAFPTSILPSTPAGRLQRVQELVDAQLIPRERALALLDMPDLEGEMNLQVAAVRDIERALEDILEHGRYVTPEPYMNLGLAVSMGQSAYLRARSDGAPGERLDKLARFIDECDRMQQAAAPPPPAGPPGMGMPTDAMGGMPMPPPVPLTDAGAPAALPPM